jgi:ribosomal protein L32
MSFRVGIRFRGKIMTPQERRKWIRSLPPLNARWKSDMSTDIWGAKHFGAWMCNSCDEKIAFSREPHPVDANLPDYQEELILPGYTFDKKTGEAIRPNRKNMWAGTAEGKAEESYWRKVKEGKAITEELENAADRAARLSMIVKDNKPGTHYGDEGVHTFSNDLHLREHELPLIAHCYRCGRRCKIISVRGPKNP